VKFPPNGFLSPKKLASLAKLLPPPPEESMDVTDEYLEEVGGVTALFSNYAACYCPWKLVLSFD